MANKIPREQADILIARCVKECQLSGNRLGIVICKSLTLKQLSNILTPERDIFYIKNDEDSINTFYKFCVEENETV